MSRYAVIIIREAMGDGTHCYVARHPELSGCIAQGETPEAAEASLEEAREMWLEATRSAGLPVPEPMVVRDGRVIDLGKWDFQ